MREFRPRLLIIEAAAAHTGLARRLQQHLSGIPGVEIREVPRWRPQGAPLAELERGAARVKSTLVVKRLDPIRFELVEELGDCLFHLARGCPLHCAYCSLTYRIPARPYVEVFGNLEEILEAVDRYRDEQSGPVRFVVGDDTDSVALEPLTGALSRAVEHFARHHRGRSRLEFLTKSDRIESLLVLDPADTTWFGYSLTSRRVARLLEHATAPVETRLACLVRAVEAGYHPLVNIAPVFVYPGWQEDYAELLDELRDALTGARGFREERLRLECEAHWQKAMELPVLERFYPGTDLELLRAGKEERQGPRGASLLVYPEATYAEMTRFFAEEMARRFPRAERTAFVPAPSPHYRAHRVAPGP